MHLSSGFAARAEPSPFEAAAYAKVTRRLIPFLFLCYVVAYLDRVNLGFAKLQMAHALRFSETVYGAGAGIFFIGYFLFEVPSNLILHRVGARRWIGRIMITWGFASAAMVVVSTPASFYLVRFVLGLAEAGFYPGIILYLTTWYPARQRGRIVALFMTAVPISSVLGAPVSGWILRSCSAGGRLQGWQWLFLIEAIPAVVLGVAAIFLLKDGIDQAGWLNPEEKALLQEQLAEEGRGQETRAAGQALLHPKTWLAIMVYFCFCVGLYGVSFWLPTIVQGAGVTDPLRIGFLTALPWAAGATAMIVVSRSSDRRGERRWHVAIPSFLSGIGFLAAAAFAHHLIPALAGLTLATLGITIVLPLFWSLPTAFLGGIGAAAGLALINSVGNLGGFLGSFMVGWIKDLTRGGDSGIDALAAAMFIGGMLVLLFPARTP